MKIKNLLVSSLLISSCAHAQGAEPTTKTNPPDVGPDLKVTLQDGSERPLYPIAGWLISATLPPGLKDSPDLRRGIMLGQGRSGDKFSFCGHDYTYDSVRFPVVDVLVPCASEQAPDRVGFVLRWVVKELPAPAAPAAAAAQPTAAPAAAEQPAPNPAAP